jgi:hypothetical protein
MKKSFQFHLVRIYIITLCFAAAPVSAGIIVVSGDSNIGNPISGFTDGGFEGPTSVPVNPNNATWLTNILQDGTAVKIQDDYSVYGEEEQDLASTKAIHDHYNSLDGVTSSVVTPGQTIANSVLAGMNLNIKILPVHDFTVAELNSLFSFLSDEGTLLLSARMGISQGTIQ